MSVDELLRPAAAVEFQTFACSTNPLVDAVVADHPDLFRQWTAAEFSELYSRFGTGGALTRSGAIEVAEAMNRRRELMHRVALVLETHEAPLLIALVDIVYKRVAIAPENIS